MVSNNKETHLIIEGGADINMISLFKAKNKVIYKYT